MQNAISMSDAAKKSCKYYKYYLPPPVSTYENALDFRKFWSNHMRPSPENSECALDY